MKQHVTIDQLNELSEKGKKKLQDWWTPEIGDIYCAVHNFAGNIEYSRPVVIEYEEHTMESFNVEDITDKDYPLLSIGQMIEFLKDNLMVDCNAFIDVCYNQKRGWYAEAGYNDNGKYMGESEELCDALWEACKEVLEQ